MIANGLKLNGGLKKLDISWNSIGSGLLSGTKCIGDALGEALAYENLIHLDLSYNKISFKDCMKIGEALKSNHKLYGLHMEGNEECYIDTLGFVKAEFRIKDIDIFH